MKTNYLINYFRSQGEFDCHRAMIGGGSWHKHVLRNTHQRAVYSSRGSATGAIKQWLSHRPPFLEGHWQIAIVDPLPGCSGVLVYRRRIWDYNPYDAAKALKAELKEEQTFDLRGEA